MKKLAVIALVAMILAIFWGCTTTPAQQPTASDNKKDKLVDKTEVRLTEVKGKNSDETFMMKGEIESIKEIELFSKTTNEEFNITLVGFKSGDGVVLCGVYPGLKNGKKVKLYLRPSGIRYKGTVANEVMRIEADTSE